MVKSYQHLDIDINKKIYKRLRAIQGDSKSRYILVNLYDNSRTFDLSNCSIKVFGLKSDKKIFFNYATIIDMTRGQFEIELTSQALAVDGELKIQILVLGANQERLTTCTFFIDIDKTIVDDEAIQSENEFNALTKGLSDLAEYDIYKNSVIKHNEDLTKHENKLNQISAQLEDNTNTINGIKNSNSYNNIAEALKDINNSRLIIPSGVYEIDEELKIECNNFQLEGLGDVTIKLTNSHQRLYIKCQNFKMSNVKFVGSGKDNGQEVIIRAYRGEFDKCRFEKLTDVYVSTVYCNFTNTFFTGNKRALTPINLIDRSTETLTDQHSTMINIRDCVFYANDTGLVIGHDTSKSPIRLTLDSTGFEHNDIGIQQNKNILLATIRGCWFELNKTYHVNLYSNSWVLENNRINEGEEKFVLKGFDVDTFEHGHGGYTNVKQNTVTTREVILQNIANSRSEIIGTGAFKIKPTNHINASYIKVPPVEYAYKSNDLNITQSTMFTSGEKYNATSNIFIEHDASIKGHSFYKDVECKKLETGIYEILLKVNKPLRYPVVNVTVYNKNNYNTPYTCKVCLDSSTGTSNYSSYGHVDKIKVYCYDSNNAAIDTKFGVSISYTIEDF